MVRMTGCPNGCARPYMAELAFVGDGPSSYQIWLGGSPVLEHRTAQPYADRVKYDTAFDFLEPILVLWRDNRLPREAFGDFAHRLGMEEVRRLSGIIGQGVALSDGLLLLGEDLRHTKKDFSTFDEQLDDLKALL